ncbi:tRNA (adenosine(37)-N6)-dimethylallyltransferase MiaA [Candidatus Pandoraea novymonadis]|uniref:tRNA dimethylallyltransferase n=1 Tax=Candidatus Pandoraea novymonadis TaxID=1808959 RepID=A0ABX5FDY0_9BURK|nr:tRNA (adenosine(37)-N6)-dimethylallyltransferase MiaA [Candidatus Pandoraea novymonadis]PSB91886.1 tRNA dimethylallyltransferase [Candidatus Pandoraea novymonadis]
MSTSTSTPIVCLLGPTTSGKTAAASALAQTTPIEIISVDSALVYREMDIGTAKPSKEELASIPHHLIDIIDPIQAYSVAKFRTDTLRLIDEIIARGRRPLLVGGTMLYHRALTQGLSPLPSADSAVREKLTIDAKNKGWPEMHLRLKKIDPITAGRLAPNDAQRIQRALEIYEISGKPMSQWIAQIKPVEKNVSYTFVPVALEPLDRSILHTRIDRRFSMMLNAGFIEEVARLRKRSDLHLGLPSMRCVGYRQIWQYLDNDIDYDTMRNKAISATRQLCKRQLTWLRAIPERRIVNCDAPNSQTRAVSTIKSIWNI